MKLGLKIGVVILPIPSLYWVFSQKNSILAKVISSLWAIFVSIFQLGSFLADEGFSTYIDFTILSLGSFFILNGIYSGLVNLINKNKKNTTLPSSSPILSDVPEHTLNISKKNNDTNNSYKDKTLTQRRLTALYNLALKILDDDNVDLEESKKLRSWLRRYPESKNDTRTQLLCITVEEVLKDNVLDEKESLELFALLSEYCDQYEKNKANEEIKKVEANLKRQAATFKRHPLTSTNFLNKLESGHEYFMSYQDSNGNPSERIIIIHSIAMNNHQTYYIKAYCLLRNCIRTFRADRVINICSTDTGEVVL